MDRKLQRERIHRIQETTDKTIQEKENKYKNAALMKGDTIGIRYK